MRFELQLRDDYAESFSALQRAENSSMRPVAKPPRKRISFQCSSASRKFLNPFARHRNRFQSAVSVLFSEPKIPQWCCDSARPSITRSFSALQRAENSSIPVWEQTRRVLRARFSALQRAENSSMEVAYWNGALGTCFSALQRAENSSIMSINQKRTE